MPVGGQAGGWSMGRGTSARILQRVCVAVVRAAATTTTMAASVGVHERVSVGTHRPRAIIIIYARL